jgi:uracil-DNA glycosylase
MSVIFEGVKPSWKKLIITDPVISTEFASIMNKLDPKTCCPKPELILEAFRYFEIDDTKVVILGQDPYCRISEAMGLSFSVPRGQKIPGSLKSIYDGLINTGCMINQPDNGDLTNWARQDVLMLHSYLTTIIGASKKHTFWSKFTDLIIKHIADNVPGVYYLLWGGEAHKKAKLIDEDESTILTWSHPSFGDNQQPLALKFRNCDHFTKVSEMMLSEHGVKFNWDPEHGEYCKIFTDGSCTGNGTATATAGSGVYILEPEKIQMNARVVTGLGGEHPTNIRAEGLAIILGLEYLYANYNPLVIDIVTDSKFWIDVITSWVHTWKSKGIIDKKKNPDLVRRLDALVHDRNVTINWVFINSHTPNPGSKSPDYENWAGNHIVDELAGAGQRLPVTQTHLLKTI